MHSPIATYLTETLESVASDTSGELDNHIIMLLNFINRFF